MTYVLIAVVIIALMICAQFMFAPMIAQRRKVREVDILKGFARYIEWPMNEIVVFERKGKVATDFIEQDLKENDGGHRYISGFNGESDRTRVSFGVESLIWEDEVIICDTIPCHIRIIIDWAVTRNKESVLKYVYDHNSPKRLSARRENAGLNTAEDRLKALTEGVNDVISRKTFQASYLQLFILKELDKRGGLSDFNVANDFPKGVEEISAILKPSLMAELSEKGANFGLEIKDVAIPIIKIDPKIQAELLDILLERQKLERARLAAEEKKITETAQIDIEVERLKSHAGVLGLDPVRIIEVLKHVHSGLLKHDKFLRSLISATTDKSAENGRLDQATDPDPPKGELKS